MSFANKQTTWLADEIGWSYHKESMKEDTFEQTCRDIALPSYSSLEKKKNIDTDRAEKKTGPELLWTVTRQD